MSQPSAHPSYTFVTKVDKVRYGDDLFDPPAGEAIDEMPVDKVKPEFVERFLAVVDELTDELMAAGNPDRANSRADAITLLIAVSEQRQDKSVESPLHYLLQEERQKAARNFGRRTAPAEPTTFMKV